MRSPGRSIRLVPCCILGTPCVPTDARIGAWKRKEEPRDESQRSDRPQEGCLGNPEFPACARDEGLGGSIEPVAGRHLRLVPQDEELPLAHVRPALSRLPPVAR